MKTKYSLLTLLVVLLVAIGCNKTDGGGPDPKPAYQMEGKWTYKDDSLNTMYIFDGGLRYTYFIVRVAIVIHYIALLKRVIQTHFQPLIRTLSLTIPCCWTFILVIN